MRVRDMRLLRRKSSAASCKRKSSAASCKRSAKHLALANDAALLLEASNGGVLGDFEAVGGRDAEVLADGGVRQLVGDEQQLAFSAIRRGDLQHSDKPREVVE